MRKILVLVLLSFFASVCLAMGTAPEPKIKTGDSSLDRALMDVDKKAATAAGAKEIENELRQQHAITQREMEFMRERRYTLSEAYYLSLLARQSGRKVRDIAAVHEKGVGWGALAKRVGVRPSDLNKLRVRMRKERKEAIREQKKNQERDRIRIHTPEAPRMKSTPPAGGGKRK